MCADTKITRTENLNRVIPSLPAGRQARSSDRNINQRQSEKCHPGAPRKSAAGTETKLSNPGKIVFGGSEARKLII